MIGMNRLRAAYGELDPGVLRYFVASSYDDPPGVGQTYNHLMGQNWSQPFGSSFVFIIFVNAGLASVFGALAAVGLSAPGWVIGVVAAGTGIGYLAGSTAFALRHYRRAEAPVRANVPQPRGVTRAQTED